MFGSIDWMKTKIFEIGYFWGLRYVKSFAPKASSAFVNLQKYLSYSSIDFIVACVSELWCCAS